MLYEINKERITHFSQTSSIKVNKSLGKSQALFREKLRKLKLRQNGGGVGVYENVYSTMYRDLCCCFFYLDQRLTDI